MHLGVASPAIPPGNFPAGHILPPPSAPTWSHGLFQAVNSIRDEMGKLQGDVTKLQGDVTKMQGDITKVLYRTSSERSSTLRHNSYSINPDASLVRVPHPDTGQLPINFPANISALRSMLDLQVDELLAFYCIAPVGDVDHRRRLLAEAIGCGYIC